MGASSVSRHTAPPLYVCYLLRSQSKANTTYIGSTPDPVRRIKQHNGLVTQGAVMTRFARPWSMDVMVYNFPSRIAALQFEWSWQSPHVSRHLRNAEHGEHAAYSGRSDAPLFPPDRKSTYVGRSGRQRTKARVSGVPEQRILVMRALLASEPFCFWNLKIAFFNEWAYGVWLYHERDADLYTHGRVTGRPLPASYPEVVCDFSGVLGETQPLAQGADDWPPLPESETESAWQKQKRTAVRPRKTTPPPGAWHETMPLARDAATLGLSWDMLKDARTLPPRKRKTRSPLHHDDDTCTDTERALVERITDTPYPHAATILHQSDHACGVCSEPVQMHEPHTFSLCPSAQADGTRCTSVFHLTCLAAHFRASTPTPRTFCLPVAGSCPCCRGPAAPWPEIVRRVFRRADLG